MSDKPDKAVACAEEIFFESHGEEANKNDQDFLDFLVIIRKYFGDGSEVIGIEPNDYTFQALANKLKIPLPSAMVIAKRAQSKIRAENTRLKDLIGKLMGRMYEHYESDDIDDLFTEINKVLEEDK